MSPVSSDSTEATEDLEVLLTEKELPFSIGEHQHLLLYYAYTRYRLDALYDSMLVQMSDPTMHDKELDTSILPTPEAYRAQMREVVVVVHHGWR